MCKKKGGGWDGTEEGNEATLVRVVSSAFSFPTVWIERFLADFIRKQGGLVCCVSPAVVLFHPSLTTYSPETFGFIGSCQSQLMEKVKFKGKRVVTR